MILETPRLLLREMTDDDFPALYAILSDPETMRYYPKPYDEAGVRRWISWCKGYAGEAAEASIRLAFEQFGFPAVYSYMKAENEPSWRTAMKNGMTLVDEYDDPVNTRTRVFAINCDAWENRCKA